MLSNIHSRKKDTRILDYPLDLTNILFIILHIGCQKKFFFRMDKKATKEKF